MTQENAQQQRISDIGHGRVFMSSCVYEFTLGERRFRIPKIKNKKARLSITDRRA